MSLRPASESSSAPALGFLSCFPTSARAQSKRKQNQPETQSHGSTSSKRRIVDDGRKHLQNASDTLYQHRDTLYSQFGVFDRRWAELYTVRPVPNKLTKGRQKPQEFHENAETLLNDVQDALDKAREKRRLNMRRRSTHGLIPSYPPSIRSVAKSITSRLSKIGDFARRRTREGGALARSYAISRRNFTGPARAMNNSHDPYERYDNAPGPSQSRPRRRLTRRRRREPEAEDPSPQTPEVQVETYLVPPPESYATLPPVTFDPRMSLFFSPKRPSTRSHHHHRRHREPEQQQHHHHHHHDLQPQPDLRSPPHSYLPPVGGVDPRISLFSGRSHHTRHSPSHSHSHRHHHRHLRERPRMEPVSRFQEMFT